MAGRLGIVAGGGELPRRLVESLPRRAGATSSSSRFEGAAEPATGRRRAACLVPPRRRRRRRLRCCATTASTSWCWPAACGGPSLAALRPDWRAAKFFARVGYRALGDDGLLSAVIAELEREGFRVVGADSILDRGAGAAKARSAASRPTRRPRPISRVGFRIARALGALDIGQAVVVQQGLVLGVEAIEGTDALLRALRRAAPRRAGRRAGQGRRSRARSAAPTCRRSGRAPSHGRRGRAARHRRRGRRDASSSTAPRSIARRRRGRALRRRRRAVMTGRGLSGRAAHLHHRRRAVGRCARRRADGGAAASAPAARLRFAGIGGERMAEQGLASLVPLARSGDHGRRRGAAARAADPAPRRARRSRRSSALRPDAVVTIDSSGFSWRVAQRLRAARRAPAAHPLCRADGLGVARRPGAAHGALVRSSAGAAAVRAALFRAGRAACSYVGHPVLESGADRGDGARLPRGARHRRRRRTRADGAARQPRRRGARGCCRSSARRLRRAAQRHRGLSRGRADRRDGRRGWSSEAVRDWPGRPIVVRGEREKYDAFAASHAALAASGTVALELAMARLADGRRLSPQPTDRLARQRIVKVEYMPSAQSDSRTAPSCRNCCSRIVTRAGSPRRIERLLVRRGGARRRRSRGNA